jgi:hypothetical protein
MNLQEKQLGQVRPANTTAASLYSPDANTTGIAKNLVICNTTTATAKFRIFVDDDGSTYDQTTALFYDVTILGNQTIQIDMFTPIDNAAGNIAVRTSIANALTFTLFGAEVV